MNKFISEKDEKRKDEKAMLILWFIFTATFFLLVGFVLRGFIQCR